MNITISQDGSKRLPEEVYEGETVGDVLERLGRELNGNAYLNGSETTVSATLQDGDSLNIARPAKGN